MKSKLTDLPLVSITITTKNEEDNIANCLESIKKQTYPQNKIEIIVVDNNSIDQTKEIAGKYTKNVFNFGPERSSQRNFGMFKKSQGKYVMFLDADMTLSSNLIEKAVYQLETSNLIGLYIPELILGNSYWSKVRNFERSFYHGTVIDCVRIIKKDSFKKTTGFDESLTGPEDWDLDKRIRQIGKVGLLNGTNHKFRVPVIPSDSDLIGGAWESFIRLPRRYAPRNDNCEIRANTVIYHHEDQFCLKKYLTKKNYYAKSFDKYIKKWGKEDPDIKKQFDFWYRYFGVFLEYGKWKSMVRQPILTLGMYFLRFLVGFIFLLEHKVNSFTHLRYEI